MKPLLKVVTPMTSTLTPRASSAPFQEPAGQMTRTRAGKPEWKISVWVKQPKQTGWQRWWWTRLKQIWKGRRRTPQKMLKNHSKSQWPQREARISPEVVWFYDNKWTKTNWFLRLFLLVFLLSDSRPRLCWTGFTQVLCYQWPKSGTKGRLQSQSSKPRYKRRTTDLAVETRDQSLTPG